jgi:large subunit ribosomal protein L11
LKVAAFEAEDHRPGAAFSGPVQRNVYADSAREARRPRDTIMVEKLQVLVDGGKATPGPPLGPALGPLGVNIVEILKAINEKTKSFEGMKVPVTLIVDPKTKSFTIEVGTPPTSALIAKELKIEKGSGDPGKTRVGNLSLAQGIKIANMKADAMLAKTLKARVLEVVGTCVSMGVTVEGKSAKDFSKDIQAGKHNKQLGG